MNNNYNGNNTGFGLDGVVNQPNSGFGLPEEQVVEQVQSVQPVQPTQPVESVQPVQPVEPVQSVPSVELDVSNNVGMGVPTEAEVNQYKDQRAMAPDIDGPVQYDYEKQISNANRADDLLGSLKTRDEREAYEAEQRELDNQKKEIQSEVVFRNEKAAEVDREKIEMQYVNHRKQPLRVENRALDPVLVEKIKKTAKKAAVAAAALGVTVGIVMGAHQVLSQPEFVPEQTPQSVELQENIEKAENMNDVIDAINEHKEQNIESGITTHPENVVEAPAAHGTVEQKSEEKEQAGQAVQESEEAVENSSMSNSMQNFVDEVNRQKVVKIESGQTIHPEQVVDNSDVVGGRGL